MFVNATEDRSLRFARVSRRLSQQYKTRRRRKRGMIFASVNDYKRRDACLNRALFFLPHADDTRPRLMFVFLFPITFATTTGKLQVRVMASRMHYLRAKLRKKHFSRIAWTLSTCSNSGCFAFSGNFVRLTRCTRWLPPSATT